MITKEQVLEHLKHVNDPEIHRSLVELNMIGEITIEGEMVTVEVKLTTAGCPLKRRMEEDIKAELAKAGVEQVQVVFGELTAEEKQRLAGGLASGKKKVFEETMVIAVGSGKGGVGKSTITANLAVAFARMGYRVGLMDADILGFSITGLMGIEHEKPQVIDETTILPIESHGVKVISMGNFADPDTALIWRAPILNRMLEQFFSNVYWGDLDYLLIDLPPATGDIPLTILQRVPNAHVVLVTTPQASASAVAARLGRMAKQMDKQILGVIENMAYFECPNCGDVYYIFGKGLTSAFAQELGTEILGQIPLNIDIQNQSDLGTPIALDSGHPMAKIYRDIAGKIVEKTEVVEESDQTAGQQ